MIEGARWRRWVFFHLPLTMFIVGLLFPFYWMIVTTVRPDRELYRPWNAANYTPFWTSNPTQTRSIYFNPPQISDALKDSLKVESPARE